MLPAILQPAEDIGTVHIGEVTAIYIKVMTMLYIAAAQDGEQADIEGNGGIDPIFGQGPEDLQLDGLQELGNQAAVIVDIQRREDSI